MNKCFYASGLIGILLTMLPASAAAQDIGQYQENGRFKIGVEPCDKSEPRDTTIENRAKDPPGPPEIQTPRYRRKDIQSNKPAPIPPRTTPAPMPGGRTHR
ncbi:MAG: hypothetical protein EG826_00445 [Deltaproteobacteria bacterium]|nr:hypothetical protein [Deltaproteobacteria bacterium]